jgi:hypothetical protein
MREITVSKPQSGFYETILGCTAIVSIGEARMRRNPEGDAVVLPDMLAPVYKATATITSGLAGLFLHPPTGSPSSGPDT